MSIMRFNFRSQALSGDVDVTIVYPTDSYSYYDTSVPRHHIVPGAPKKLQYVPGMKFQTVYLLHAGAGDDTAIYRYTNVERYAQRNHVMLVTPRLLNSFGVNTAYGIEYSNFITDELPVVIQTLFASSPKREDNFIAGCAAGGNAALYNALKRPDLYSVCVDMSGGIGPTLDTAKLKAVTSGELFNHFKLFAATFGDPEKLEGSELDTAYLARRNIQNKAELPKFYFVAGGNEGGIRDSVKKDAELLQAMNYDVTYIEVPGKEHHISFWNEYFEIMLDEMLPLKRQPILP